MSASNEIPRRGLGTFGDSEEGYTMINTMLDAERNLGDQPEGDKIFKPYYTRHGVQSAPFLTVVNDEQAGRMAEYLAPRIKDKTVIEIGGGIGWLSMRMGTIAKRVYCIEANPIWTACFIAELLRDKPRNVSYLFGTADEFLGQISADVAVVCSRSGQHAMMSVAKLFAPIALSMFAGSRLTGCRAPFTGEANDDWPRPIVTRRMSGV